MKGFQCRSSKCKCHERLSRSELAVPDSQQQEAKSKEMTTYSWNPGGWQVCVMWRFKKELSLKGTYLWAAWGPKQDRDTIRKPAHLLSSYLCQDLLKAAPMTLRIPGNSSSRTQPASPPGWTARDLDRELEEYKGSVFSSTFSRRTKLIT